MELIVYILSILLYSYSVSVLKNQLRRQRSTSGLSQGMLAARVGISRQAYSSIEKGDAAPSTTVALKLAHHLQTTVDLLFSLEEDSPSLIEAHLATSGTGDETEWHSKPVHLYQVGSKWIARAFHGVPSRPSIQHSLLGPHGVRLGQATKSLVSPHVSVKVLGSSPLREKTISSVGCDPAIALVANHIRPSGADLVSYQYGSQEALEQLSNGYAHIAGCHLLDSETGQFNIPWIKRIISFPVSIITFSVWEQGLMIKPGNPKGIRGLEDLARPGIFMINREFGSGSRSLLDRELQRLGIGINHLAGYDLEARSHLLVAEMIAVGVGDVGIGVKAAANATGLDFIPLREERYDVIIPNHFLELESIQRIIESMSDPSLKKQVEALGGYDVSPMGKFVGSIDKLQNDD